MKEGVYNHDPTAVACLYDPTLSTLACGATRVIPDGIAMGQTLMDVRSFSELEDAWKGVPPIKATIDLQQDLVIQLMKNLLL